MSASSTAGRHGTTAGYAAGCRQECCRAAWAAEKRRVTRLQAYGRWLPYVDAGPVADRIGELLAAGATMAGLAEVTGVPRATLIKAYRPIAARPRSRRVRPAVAAAVLAVEPWMVTPVPDAFVDEIERMLHGGECLTGAAARLSATGRPLTRSGLERRLQRIGRHDLARRLAANEVVRGFGVAS